MAKKIGDKSCQSNFYKQESDFGSSFKDKTNIFVPGKHPFDCIHKKHLI